MTAQQMVAFFWEVPLGGFRWLDASAVAGGTPQRWLTEAIPVGLAVDVRRYSPLDEYPALFRTFADTPLTEDGISRFANQFGGLGAWEQIRLTAGPELVMGMGEPRHIWMNEIDAMRRAAQLWDAVRHRDTLWFQQHVRVEPKSSEEIWVSYLEEGVLYHREVIGPDLAGFVRPHDVRRPTLLFVQKMINMRLWEHTAPRLLCPKTCWVRSGSNVPGPLTRTRIIAVAVVGVVGGWKSPLTPIELTGDSAPMPAGTKPIEIDRSRHSDFIVRGYLWIRLPSSWELISGPSSVG
jgi:hypothetical protein